MEDRVQGTGTIGWTGRKAEQQVGGGAGSKKGKRLNELLCQVEGEC